MKIGQKLDSKTVCDMISPNTKDDVLQCKLEGKVAQIVVDFFFSIISIPALCRINYHSCLG